jgi:hypothetical protein
MTLDEAIKHAEEVAEENQRVVDTGIVFDDVTIGMLYCDDTEVIEEHLANYQRCADKHKQLAEWLKELKQLREQTRWIPVSERLPDTDDEFLCWYKYYHWSKEKVLPEYGLGCYLQNTQAWCGEVAQGKDVEVIAWMPLPEPYKESEVKKE